MFSKKRPGRPPKKESRDAYVARLEMENDLLKKFHTELREVLREKRNIGASNTNSDDTK
jgi:hypothetical protein